MAAFHGGGVKLLPFSGVQNPGSEVAGRLRRRPTIGEYLYAYVCILPEEDKSCRICRTALLCPILPIFMLPCIFCRDSLLSAVLLASANYHTRANALKFAQIQLASGKDGHSTAGHFKSPRLRINSDLPKKEVKCNSQISMSTYRAFQATLGFHFMDCGVCRCRTVSGKQCPFLPSKRAEQAPARTEAAAGPAARRPRPERGGPAPSQGAG